MALHCKVVRDVGICNGSMRIYEVEVYEVMLNDIFNASTLSQGSMVPVETSASPPCGQQLQLGTEYLLHLRSFLPGPLFSEAASRLSFRTTEALNDTELAVNTATNTTCESGGLLTTSLCDGNLASPGEEALQQSRETCKASRQTKKKPETSALSDIPSVLGASCILVMLMLRMASVVA